MDRKSLTPAQNACKIGGMSHDTGAAPPPESREPTLEELLPLMHADELAFWKSGSGSPEQREEFLESLKARWRAAQEPVGTPPSPAPPERKPDNREIKNPPPARSPSPPPQSEEKPEKKPTRTGQKRIRSKQPPKGTPSNT